MRSAVVTLSLSFVFSFLTLFLSQSFVCVSEHSFAPSHLQTLPGRRSPRHCCQMMSWHSLRHYWFGKLLCGQSYVVPPTQLFETLTSSRCGSRVKMLHVGLFYQLWLSPAAIKHILCYCCKIQSAADILCHMSCILEDWNKSFMCIAI